jgi:fructuronate reductase
VLNLFGGDWGICEVMLFGGEELIKSLRHQAHRFTVLEKGINDKRALIIGSANQSLHARLDGIDAVIGQLTEPQVAIVSLTITEKGYCLNGANGCLDYDNQLVKRDLALPTAPCSAPGVLVEALRRRRAHGLTPFTVLSCDNIPENGRAARSAVLELAQSRDPGLKTWIEQQVSFPNTMVDRIVPAATPETLEEIKRILGFEDPCGIACEPFIQWVVEDKFVAGRPAWDQVGAQLVQDVLPFEEMKLRMLNGSHSFLAYLGYLGGYQHISDCMADPHYRRAVHHLMIKEQAPTLNVAGVDLEQYANQLIERFTNPELKHRTWQIAMDGSQKLPQRLLASIRWHLAHGGDMRALILGVAAWMRYVSGSDDGGDSIDVKDPLLSTLQKRVANSNDGAERVQALLGIESLFGKDLPCQIIFVNSLIRAYQQLVMQGARAAVRTLLD